MKKLIFTVTLGGIAMDDQTIEEDLKRLSSIFASILEVAQSPEREFLSTEMIIPVPEEG